MGPADQLGEGQNMEEMGGASDEQFSGQGISLGLFVLGWRFGVGLRS